MTYEGTCITINLTFGWDANDCCGSHEETNTLGGSSVRFSSSSLPPSHFHTTRSFRPENVPTKVLRFSEDIWGAIR